MKQKSKIFLGRALVTILTALLIKFPVETLLQKNCSPKDSLHQVFKSTLALQNIFIIT